MRALLIRGKPWSGLSNYLVFRLRYYVDNQLFGLRRRSGLFCFERVDELFLESLFKIAYLGASEAEIFWDIDFNFGSSHLGLPPRVRTRCEKTAEYTTVQRTKEHKRSICVLCE